MNKKSSIITACLFLLAIPAWIWFGVRKVTGEKIFAVERLYGIYPMPAFV